MSPGSRQITAGRLAAFCFSFALSLFSALNDPGRATSTSIRMKHSFVFVRGIVSFVSFCDNSLQSGGWSRRGDLGSRGCLDSVQFGIHAVLCQQRLVSALFDQFGIFDDKDDVGVADRAEMMCNDDGRSPFHQGVEGSDNRLFGGGV